MEALTRLLQPTYKGSPEMANATFTNAQAREKEIKTLFFNITYAPTAATATLATTTEIELTKVATNSLYNGHTTTLQVAAAAANPTDTVLAVWTGTAAATTITVTPNDGTNNPTTQATGTLGTTTPIVLTKTVAAQPGTAGNGDTFTLQVVAAAANPAATILAVFSGTANATVCTITPNDGTNNGATPVNLTTAELVELINTGLVAGKTVTITDGSGFRNDQTATGGDATNLADSGEGDGEVATFAGGVNTAVGLTTEELVELINNGTVAGKTVTVTDGSNLRDLVTATGGDTTDLADSGEGDGEVATFAGATDFTTNNAAGFSSFDLTAAGTIRARLDDKWIALRGASFAFIDSTARDYVAQIKAYDLNPTGANGYIDIYTNTAATPTTIASGVKLMGTIHLKNSTLTI